MRSLLLSALVVAGLGLASRADAHPMDIGYLKLTSSASAIHVELDIDARAASALLGGAAIDEASAQTHRDQLAIRSFAAAPVSGCTWQRFTAALADRTVTLGGDATCDDAPVRTWSFPFVREHRVSPAFELMLKESAGASEHLTLVDATTATVTLAQGSATPTSLAHFVWSGVEHIGAAPSQWHTAERGWTLPEGIDHLVFVLGLVLGGGTLLQLLGLATGFTLGHSITLAIAALGIVRPPSSVIEPLVALSIAVVAFEARGGRARRHRWKLAMGFGLIHGFAFANALAAMHLTRATTVKALFGFNLGVELGQLVFVLAMAPFVLWLHRQRRMGPLMITALSAVIFVLGLYWFVCRIAG